MLLVLVTAWTTGMRSSIRSLVAYHIINAGVDSSNEQAEIKFCIATINTALVNSCYRVTRYAHE